MKTRFRSRASDRSRRRDRRKSALFPALLPLALAICAAGCFSEPGPLTDADLALEYAVPEGHIDTDTGSPCAERNPTRNAYFGDLHVHTSISGDSYMFGGRLRPDDAYRYAFGGSVRLPNAAGEATRSVRIDRPLDFAAVTDHAEFFGEGELCVDPNDPAYDASMCESLRTDLGRSFAFAKHIMLPIGWREDDVCGADGQRCRDAARTVWQENIEAAREWNDESSRCERTTFIAYEYSSHRMGSNLHRNVIFKNTAVPSLPISYIEATREWDLWALLKSGCIDTESGCDVLAIPHNANISNGRMWNVEYAKTGSEDEQRERARLRMQLEPIAEIMQHKGDSECHDGVPGVLDSEDELCQFEKFADATSTMRSGRPLEDECPEGGLAPNWPHLGPDCLSRLSFARYALIEGLAEQRRIGVNPFKFGLMASTDTHNALAGGVDERSYPGHLGKADSTIAMRAALDPDIPGNTANNPGGLVGIWAEENSRNALFDAMKRKEVFGTSGPRIRPRLHASWALPSELCEVANMRTSADALAVPMGADLPPKPPHHSEGPVFLALALADPGAPGAMGTPLQRLQMIKGWIDADGERRTKVFDIAGDPDNGAQVDVDTCEQSGGGYDELCTVWHDPDFDPALDAVYYLRAVENPSCRYNAWQCAGLGGDARPASCDDPDSTKIIQERAWTSPIWYSASAPQPG